MPQDSGAVTASLGHRDLWDKKETVATTDWTACLADLE